MDRDTSIGRATVRQVCAAFRISRQAYYQALRSPVPREPANDESTRRRRGPWVSDDELVERIPGIVESNPGWGSRKVWASLTRRGLGVSRRRVWKRMQAMGLLLPAPQHLPRERRGKVAVPDSNRLWGTDLTTIYTREDGLVAIVPVIDFGDRFVLECQVMKSQESWSVLAPTEAALPLALLTVIVAVFNLDQRAAGVLLLGQAEPGSAPDAAPAPRHFRFALNLAA